MRLIPGRTKVRIEIFKGVSLWDILVVFLGAALVVLFAISSLPWKLGICIAIAFITFFLVLKLDEEPNYMFILRILKYLVLPRRFDRVYDDEMLKDKKSGKLREDLLKSYRQDGAAEASGRVDQSFVRSGDGDPENNDTAGNIDTAAEDEGRDDIDFEALERFADDIATDNDQDNTDVILDDVTAELAAQLGSDEGDTEEAEGEGRTGESEEGSEEEGSEEEGSEEEESEEGYEEEESVEEGFGDGEFTEKTASDDVTEDTNAETHEDETDDHEGIAADSDGLHNAEPERIAEDNPDIEAVDNAGNTAGSANDNVEADGTDSLHNEDAENDVDPSNSRKKDRKRKRQERTQKKKEKKKPDTYDKTPDQLKSEKELRKEKKRELKALIKEENRILKSKTATEEEKNAVWAARAERSALKKKEKEDAKYANGQGEFMDNLVAFTDIKDDFIEFGGKYYATVIEIDPIEFRFFSRHRRNNSIENGLGKTLRSIQEGNYANIVKIERPIKYDEYMDKEYDRLDQLRVSYESGMISEVELQSRVEVLYDRINELSTMCFDKKVITAFYYLVLFEEDRERLLLQTANALNNMEKGEMVARRLGTKDIAVFLKYTNQLDFDERDIDNIAPEDYAQWAMPENVRIRVRDTIVSNVITHTWRVTGYPTLVGDAFLAGVMSIPGTKVVLKCTPIDRNKSITSIDRSLQELRSQYQSTNIDSKIIELTEHIQSLSGLLSTLQSDNETMMDVNIYVTAYDIAASRMDPSVEPPEKSSLPIVGEMHKIVRQLWGEENIRITRMDFDQLNGFIGSQVSNYDPLKKLSRGMPSNSVAACFPWIYSHISDESGFKLGSAEGVPVFVDFFRRDDERINSNMVIIGKSGSGKSYATKSLLANLAADDAKIFILDPENEYQELANNLHGKIINVGNAQYGRLNPFHIITALDDDDDDSGSAVTGSFATHLQFLEEFFKQILPDCEKDALEYLNSLVERMYTNHGIYADTDLSAFAPEDYPIFDDLYDEVLAEFERTENEYLRTMLRTLINYIAKFSTGGRNANIWNGPSTITTDENFTVFNFQSMLSNRNTTIANAQMLLVLKYIDNEIIKNRDYNTKYNLNRKIVVVIDEAHVFIDDKFPIALDFMFQLAKRIRKYNGMQIVITQNIKDFVGSEELARKSTAIINACQYSFIFALAPNDMHDLCKLYEKAGGINENEQEQIMQAPRGQAFTVLSASSRSTFQVEVPPAMVDMFQQKEYISHYFIGQQGHHNWESYVADSRAAHDSAVEANRASEEKVRRNAPKKSAVTFNILSEDEFLEKTADISADTFDTPVTPDEEVSGLGDLDLFDADISDEDFDAMIARKAAERKAAGSEAFKEEETDAVNNAVKDGAADTEKDDTDITSSLAETAPTSSSPATRVIGETVVRDGVVMQAANQGMGAENASAASAGGTVSGNTYISGAPQGRATASPAADIPYNSSDLEMDIMRREIAIERSRLEAEKLETQRKTLELERAAIEADRSAGMSEAVLKLGEMLQLMQQQIMLQQSALGMGAAGMVPAAGAGIAVGAAGAAAMPNLSPAAGVAGSAGAASAAGIAAAAGALAGAGIAAQTQSALPSSDAFGAAEDGRYSGGAGSDDSFDMSGSAGPDDRYDPMDTTGSEGDDDSYDSYDTSGMSGSADDSDYSDASDMFADFGLSEDSDAEDEDLNIPDDTFDDDEDDEDDEDDLLEDSLDIPDLSEAVDIEDEDEEDEDDELDFDLDDEDGLDLPEEDEFEKFLFGDDDDDDDDDEDDDDSGLSFNIFDMFEQEADYIEHYNPMDDFMDGDEEVLEITIEQLIDFNKNRHKNKSNAG